MNQEPVYHIPALLESTIEVLKIHQNGVYVDATFGGGGHSKAILDNLGLNGKLFGFDQDSDALSNIWDDKRLELIHANFNDIDTELNKRNIKYVDGIIADLGVSFHHFDTPERGFSFRFNTFLDMRMNQKQEQTAFDVINYYELDTLKDVLKEYGELSKAYYIAKELILHRPIYTTFELNEVVKKFIPKGKGEANKYLAQIYQALRIEVNDEIGVLKRFLEKGLLCLNANGAFVIITYHSLEDRYVKRFFQGGNLDGKIEKDFYGNPISPWQNIHTKVIIPSRLEVESNPRSRSAKLRYAYKK